MSQVSNVVKGYKRTKRNRVPLMPVCKSMGLLRTEEDVLKLLYIGLTRDQISARLGVHRSVVSWRIKAMFKKSGTTDKTSLISWANQQGFFYMESSNSSVLPGASL